jgi:ABC-2 type transport system permease protein
VRTSLPLYRDAVLGVISRDWTTYKSYRMQLITQIASVFLTLALFHFISRLVRVQAFGSRNSYFSYVVVGMIIIEVLQSTLLVGSSLQGELVAGTFERVMVSPFGPVAAVLSSMIFPFLSSFVGALITLFLGTVAFGLHVHWSTAALAIPIAFLAAGSFAAVGLIFCSSTVLFKRIVGGAGLLITGIALVSGLYFPIALLPGWITWFSNIQPFTPSVELLRHVLVDTPLRQSASSDLLKLAGFLVVLLPVSVLLLQAAMRLGKRRGTIIEY